MRDAWRQFHGSASNTGFKFRPTRHALRPEWRLELEDWQGGASPVVDSQGVIYLGSAEGHLVAVTPDGTERWRRNYGNPIIASPAVAESGSIYFIVQIRTGTNPDAGDGEAYVVYRSILMKANPSGGFEWSVDLPDEGFTNSAPKVWDRADGERVLVYFTRRTSGGPAGELCVLDAEGRLRARSGDLGCPWPVSGTPGIIKAFARWAKRAWEGIKDFPHYEFDTSGIRLFPQYLEPTAALTDASNLVDDGAALVAVADNLCRVAVYRYDGSRLEQLWQRLHDLELKHSSPTITPPGHLVIGDETGKVTAFDVLTGREAWTYDAEEPVLGTPASFGQPIYVLSSQHIHVVHAANGHQIDKSTFARGDTPQTLSSPVVSTERIHVAHDRGLVSYEVGDVRRRGHDQDYRLGALSPSPAMGPEGELYVIHDSCQLWAYAGP